MKGPRKNTRQPRRKRSVVLRLVLLAFLGYGIFTLGQLQFDLFKMDAQHKELVQKRREVEMRSAEITNLLQNGTEAEFVERAARERLGYVFPDEEVFVDKSGK